MTTQGSVKKFDEIFNHFNRNHERVKQIDRIVTAVKNQ